MADFYPVLARAVSSMPRNDARARQELYARARTIVIEQSRGREPTPETKYQQAALETAIRRLEAEAQSKTTAKSLATILKVLQAEETRSGASEPSDRLAMNRAETALASAAPKFIESTDKRNANVTAELSGIPRSLGTMLLGIAYISAAMAFTGVTYIRAVVWVYQGVIGYPMLLVVMAVTLALFIAPPVAIFRKRSTSAFGPLRYISRRKRMSAFR